MGKEENGEDPNDFEGEDVFKATKHIIKYDFIFCFYVFALPAATFYNCYAITTIATCLIVAAPALVVSMSMIAYGFATMTYFPVMYCGTCCAASGKKVKSQAKKETERHAPAVRVAQSDAELDNASAV